MTVRCCSACLFLIPFYLCSVTTAQEKAPFLIADNTPINVVVHQLGTDNNDVDRIKFLAKEPAASARLLIQELHPVNGARILGSEHHKPQWRHTEHVIWCLRALRTLSGFEFRAKTRHNFGHSELETNREWFTGGEQYPADGTVRFYGVWMSRDSLYIAPRDAQQKIIAKWKEWYAKNGQTYTYKAFENDPDDWYF